MIERAITADGRVGYDKFNQLLLATMDGSSTCYRHIADVRNKICSICERGWDWTANSMSDQFQWDLVDDYVHGSCLIRHTGLIERAEFHHALVRNKIRFDGLKPIENRYWPKVDPWSKKPWYETNPVSWGALLVIGWRKNVISILVDKEVGHAKDFDVTAMEKAFHDEDVTKEFGTRMFLVHAWGYDKLKEYLGKLKGVLENDK